MHNPDVLVLGGGLGGTIAGLAAARRDPTADVVVVRRPTTPFDRDNGLVSILGYAPGDDEPVVDPLAAVEGLPADHPYSVLGRDALRDGLALFDDAAGGQYCGADTSTNALVPSPFGTPTPAARYPAAVAPGVLSREEPTLLVGFPDLPDFHAPFVADRLEAAGVPFPIRGVTTTAPTGEGDLPPALEIAASFDAAPTAEAGPYTTVERVGRPVQGLRDDETRVGFPAILGVEEPATVHATLADRADAEIFEVPLGPPSVLGRRLEGILHDALRAADVSIVTGMIEGLVTDGDRIGGVRLAVSDGPNEGTDAEGDEVALEPAAAVLATGGPADGGIVASREQVSEPVVGCHVLGDDTQVRATADPLGEHAFARYGVAVDGDARPLTADGDPACGSLFAAGAILGGNDFVAEQSLGGVSLASGFVAGTRAVEADR